MNAPLERPLILATLSGVCVLAAFQAPIQRPVEEIRAKRILIVDSMGKGRVLLASDYKNDNSAGIYFFNQEGTEAGALAYNGKRGPDGVVEAYSILTMDQFQSDEVVRLAFSQTGGQKRQGLTISDRPDTLTAEARQVLNELSRALQASRTSAEAQALRREYLARVPGRALGASRLFVGRNTEGTAVVTLSDPDGKPRLRLQVDSLGNASITFLDVTGRVVRAITP